MWDCTECRWKSSYSVNALNIGQTLALVGGFYCEVVGEGSAELVSHAAL